MLTFRRPTPTTIQYTVSTRAATTGIAARARSSAVLVLRLLAGALVAVAVLLESRLLAGDWEAAILTSPSGQLAARLAAHIGWSWRMLLGAGVTWLIFRKGYTEESLLVMRGLGVQTSTSSPSYLSTSSTRFIPTTAIQDIFIHEAFKGFEVRFYLSIVVEGEEDVVVVFPSILPRREFLEPVWRGARACLHEPKA